jgi:hypothetical protein
MKPDIHALSYLVHFLLELRMSQPEVVQNIKTHILCSVNFFFENCAVFEIVWKNTVKSDRP